MVDFYSNVNDGGKSFITLALAVDVKLSSLKIQANKLKCLSTKLQVRPVACTITVLRSNGQYYKITNY